MKKIIKSRLLAVSGHKVLVLEKVGKPLRYTLPGGVKKRKETEKQTLIRETAEEIELQLTEEQVHFYMSHINKMETGVVIKNYYHVHFEPLKIKVLEKHKFQSALWLNWKKVIGFMDKSDRLAVKAYFKNLKTKNKNMSKNERTISSRIAM
ncbi:NUDIX hydrolase [Flagellimonas sp. 389]|uniref:NUDIX domain-containing protein n=1 Tax=Flagellimonas sp. 389 TaxID=2835862 RepID=UPI001BD4A5EC|nr:NUDIX hydrolase [Flagellimonas sp. 389]MBS9464038.1 NUDIX hydrolase [Flagellimonas sp. 389]